MLHPIVEFAIIVIFPLGSLLLPLYFVMSGLISARKAKIGKKYKKFNAAKYLNVKGTIGGSVAVSRLIMFSIVFWQRFPWSESEGVVMILLLIWISNESIMLKAWRRLE